MVRLYPATLIAQWCCLLCLFCSCCWLFLHSRVSFASIAVIGLSHSEADTGEAASQPQPELA